MLIWSCFHHTACHIYTRTRTHARTHMHAHTRRAVFVSYWKNKGLTSFTLVDTGSVNTPALPPTHYNLEKNVMNWSISRIRPTSTGANKHTFVMNERSVSGSIHRMGGRVGQARWPFILSSHISLLSWTLGFDWSIRAMSGYFWKGDRFTWLIDRCHGRYFQPQNPTDYFFRGRN